MIYVLFLLMVVLYPALMMARGWSGYDARRRRTALQRAAMLLASVGAGGAMAGAVDGGATAEWPAWGRTAWVLGIFLCMGCGFHAWIGLTKGWPSDRAPNCGGREVAK